MRPPTRMGVWVSGVLLALAPSVASAENLYEIDRDDEGYAIYRSGRPDGSDMAEYCELGITEMMVLSGNASEYEGRFQEQCPGLVVVLDEMQDPEVPLSESFLRYFDEWVAKARREHSKIAFRCNCGCHRTGRLAAYYQMKHRGLSVEEAEALMMQRGKWMFLFPGLKKQLRALDDHINDRRCSTRAKYCVRSE